jgi:upstream activation factor subunit UAF30
MNNEETELDCQGQIFKDFDNIIFNLNLFKTNINTMQQNMKQLEKSVKKELNYLKKKIIKSKNKGHREPSGFAKPCKVTKELCNFMNKEEGTEIARTEVTKALISYVKENKLNNGENGKIILPDEKLKTLLGIQNDDDELTYFTIQKYMNKHFIKS